MDSVQTEQPVTPGRYDAMIGPNTKQFWLYDNENNTYIDPPIAILREADSIRWKSGTQTAESISEAEAYLEKLALTNPDWLHDGYEYPADETDI